jgi:flagellar biosynthesis GTPase FlhF
VTDPSSSPSDTSSNPDGVRTYRGRTIEELIPRIRAELGPDAIILREREGLMGGIGGFFAQKCVEIDAQAAPRVNVYADDFEDEEYDEELEGTAEDYDGFTVQPPAGYVPLPLPDAATQLPAPEPEAAPAPAAAEAPVPVPPVSEAPLVPPTPAPPVSEIPAVTPAAPEPPAPAPPAPAAPFLDEASFAARLEEATFAAEPVAPEPEPEPEPEAQVAAAAPPAFIAFDEMDEPQVVEEPEPVVEEAEPVAVEPAPPVSTPLPLDPAPWLAFAAESPWPEPEPEPVVEEPAAQEPVVEEREVEETLPPEPEPEPEPEASEESQPQPEPEPEPEPAPEPTPAPVTPAAAAHTPPPPAPPVPQYGYGRRRGGLLPAAERMLRAALDATSAANERREREYHARQERPPAPAAIPFPSAATPPAPDVAPDTAREEAQLVPERDEQHRREADLERRLIRAGLTQSRAAALVGAAISRRGPFSAGGSLTEEIQAMIAASLPAPTSLPTEHGAVAVVGAGGSGKTRAVAALAAAQARAGALVSVASLGAPGREDELGALLHGEAVNIIPAMRTRATARAVSSARGRGLVIIDTAAVTPRDDSTIDVMAETLHGFGLDGIYLAVPATLSSSAAIKLIDSFSAFDLTGMIATHVDETDQIGQVAELAMQTGIPLAYTHTGIELQKAIESADPEHIAAELLR